MLFVKKYFLNLFLERGRQGEREGEKHKYVVACCTPPTGNLAHNPGMCPDWESNRQPFGSQAGTQSTEPHQPGLGCFFKKTETYTYLYCLLKWFQYET